MMRLVGFVAVAVAVLAAGPAGAASFDCAKARQPDELLICGDPAVSKADERLAAAYAALLKATDPSLHDRLKAEQRAWVGQRNTGCGVTAKTKVTAENRGYLAPCFLETIQERVAALESLRAGLPVSLLVQTRTTTDDNKAKKYRITATVPELPATAAGAPVFNSTTAGMARRPMEAFRKAFATPQDMGPVSDDRPAVLDLSFRLSFATPSLVSAQLWAMEDTGGAHPNTSTTTTTIDLAAGRTLGVADVFKPGSGWEKAVTDFARKDLRRQAKEADNDLTEEDLAQVPKLVAEMSRWKFGPEAAIVTFDPYDVCCYAFGYHEVAVPYAFLKPYLAPGAPLPVR